MTVHVVDLVVLRRVRVRARIGVVDTVDPRVRALEQRVGFDLGSAQRSSGVGREERVAGTGGEDHDPTLLQVPHRPTPDVRLGDAWHLDRGLDPGRLTATFECVLQRQRVHHGAEHADVVALRGVHALHRTGATTPEVATADHDGDVDVEVLADVDDLGGRLIERRAVETPARLRRRALRPTA